MRCDGMKWNIILFRNFILFLKTFKVVELFVCGILRIGIIDIHFNFNIITFIHALSFVLQCVLIILGVGL